MKERIPPGQVAISVQVDQVKGVANLIVPGDQVNLLATAPDGERYLYQNVNVIAVGATPAPQPGETTASTTPAGGSGLLTFAVPPQAAAKISVANGLYLTLVPPGNQPVAVPSVDEHFVTDGGVRAVRQVDGHGVHRDLTGDRAASPGDHDPRVVRRRPRHAVLVAAADRPVDTSAVGHLERPAVPDALTGR